MDDKDDDRDERFFQEEIGKMLPIANALNLWVGRLYAQQPVDLVFRACMLTFGWHARYCGMTRDDFLTTAGAVWDLAGALETVDRDRDRDKDKEWN